MTECACGAQATVCLGDCLYLCRECFSAGEWKFDPIIAPARLASVRASFRSLLYAERRQLLRQMVIDIAMDGASTPNAAQCALVELSEDIAELARRGGQS